MKSAKVDTSEQRLRELGYTQELKRELTSFTNFSVSFSIISVLTGIGSLYGSGLVSGGPVVVIWGWPIVSLFTLFIALAMAEICSSFPTSGGVYFWSAKLAGKHGPFMCWMTGWFNLVGQYAITAGIDFGLAMMLCGTLSIATGGTFETTPPKVVLIYLAFLVVHGLMNTFAVKLIAVLNTVSVWWHIVGVGVITVLVLGFAPTHASPKWVFTDFENGTGWSSDVYAALLGLLMSQFTMTGYDASALMTEETKRADIAGPVGIIMAVIVSFFAGWTLLFGLTFGIQDYSSVVNSPSGVAIAQLFLDAIGMKGALLCMSIVMGAMFFAGMAAVTANSRMMYALSRDHVVPASSVWHRIHPTFKTPVYAVWASVCIAGSMGALYLVNTTAFTAITSLATICLNLSYGLPILCRLVNPSAFEPGPVALGVFSKPIGCAACLWIAFTTVLFTLPTAYPITAVNMNYTSVGMAGITFFIVAYWLLSAKQWFKGPLKSDTPFPK